MKITDFALVFIGITLPIILIAYVNIAFTIRTYQQEMYYQKVIDGAVEDTISEMKRIESDEITNDYGYSGTLDNKISINPELAISTFFDSLYNSLDLYGDKQTQSLVQLYVPVVAIIDYNGVYISSVEEYVNKDGQTVIGHILKPKRYFSFEYAYASSELCYIKDGQWVYAKDDSKVTHLGSLTTIHNVEFTTDDRVFHVCTDDNINREFYLRDSKNNESLFYGYMGSDREKILELLEKFRIKVLIDVVEQELSYAANKNNEYAHAKGISYNFAFTVDSSDEMYNYIRNVGVLALVQGIKVGNKYLNYKAYNVSDLVLTHNYYFSEGSTKFASKLYHKTKNCLEYIQCGEGNNLSPNVVYTKEEAAKFGYYPCPLCNP